MTNETNPLDPEGMLRDPNEHTPLEDIYAMITGCTLLAIGLVLMQAANIVTAGVAGIALLMSYVLPLGVGPLFFLISLPFLAFGGQVLGREYVIKTVVASGLIFGIAAVAQRAMHIADIHPAFAALAGGTCAGMGILALVRHNCGAGGITTLALYLHRTRGWSVGRLQLMVDTVIVTSALLAIPPERIGWSALSILAINMILIAWHKPGRYLGY
ncbi:YitT family protein [Croceibacterium ferulae]|uniref:YitT family protein n=1 Tax=Croceibacterium ferulae TaxID=1854641 RepID=UPI000EAF62B1|nr:YitT family protein [Croceibacterium ferulae]